MHEFTIREFHEGHKDGEQEVASPGAINGDKKHIVIKSSFGTIDGVTDDEYEFSHEETKMISVRIWHYKRNATAE